MGEKFRVTVELIHPEEERVYKAHFCDATPSYLLIRHDKTDVRIPWTNIIASYVEEVADVA